MTERIIDRCFNRIMLNTKNINKLWVYAVYNQSAELVFISYGTLKEIVSMSPLKTLEKFNEDENYVFLPLQACNSKIEAENALTGWINNSELNGKTPPLNLYNRGYNSNNFIQCIENGRFYRTATDVVKIFGVAQSALSNHLRGVPGHKSVKGLHFKYYTGDNPAEIEQAGGYKLVRGDFGGYKSIQSDCPINKLGITESEKRSNIEKLTNQFGRVIW